MVASSSAGSTQSFGNVVAPIRSFLEDVMTEQELKQQYEAKSKAYIRTQVAFDVTLVCIGMIAGFIVCSLWRF